MNLMKIICVLLLAACAVQASVEEDVQYIRSVYGDVGEQIENGELYRTSVEINADGLSYPAVGVYHGMLDFYFGFAEESPYPDNLMKAVLTMERSAYEEYTEFLYNGYGDLIFVYATGQPNMPEMRFYYKSGEVFRIVEGSETLHSFDDQQLEYADRFMRQGTDLVETLQRLFF